MNRPSKTKPELMPLCCGCASQFYYSGSCRIRRADPLQTEKDTCTFCGCRRGFDYLIYPINDTRRSRRPQNIGKGGTSLCTVRTAY